jgi:hypothetical protein
MNAQINGVLEQIREKLAESAWGSPELPSALPPVSSTPPAVPPLGSSSIAPDDVEDALDMYLSGMVDSLMNQYDATDEEAADTVFAAIDQAVKDGKLPEMPSDTAKEPEVSLWVGKATIANLQRLVNEYARNNAED